MAFGAQSTASQVIQGTDLSGTTAVVTGANSGIGFETARILAAAGARVIVTARDRAKVEETLTQLREQVPGAKVEGVEMELSSLESVRAAADRIREIAPQLHLLINNAGIMFAPYELTKEGFESHFGVNHLGHFVLTGRLVPSLVAGARVLDLSSSAHMFSGIRWDDPNWAQGPYNKFLAYSQSKTANILHALELDRRLAGRGVRAFSLHPGGIRTNLLRYMGPEDSAAVREAYKALPNGETVTYSNPLKTIPQGAATTVWGAVSHDLDGKGGLFLSDCQIAPPGTGARVGYMDFAVDPKAAERLWAMSEEMAHERFPLA
jgi:NAD(P)-dependent dehydrogenase (short-subunit alcohol dehydrogenase family)